LVALALAGYATVTTEAGWGVLVMAAAAGCSILALSLVLLGRIPTEWIVSGPFAFRPAATRATPTAHVAATFVQLVLFWGSFLAVFPIVLSLLERRWSVGIPFPSFAVPAGIALLVLASALGISSAISMSTRGDGTPLPSAMPNRLVIAGPYRLIRNPMAVAGIIQGAAVGVLLSSWLVIVYAVIGCILWNYAVRPLEEADLDERFGDEFRRYQDSVRCWIPGVASLTGRASAQEQPTGASRT
jgi:protein-S-isoprenylcysteine O-methyltransferase Ste14